jgi:hypothetical protein
MLTAVNLNNKNEYHFQRFLMLTAVILSNKNEYHLCIIFGLLFLY